METDISAVAGELLSRLISFLTNKCQSSRVAPEEKLQRLHHLLMRVRTVVEEADARYITNSGMLMQLQMLSQAMYQGHGALDSFRYRAPQGNGVDEVSRPSNLPLKRPRIVVYTRDDKVLHDHELNSALQNLETDVANMAEFVVLLVGCEHMSRRPYDTYLYTDNFLFSRHAEKQKLLNFLLGQNPPGAPAVLPIIGGRAVGKKSLVAHVCNDERVRSRFTSILHLTGDCFLGILDLHTSIQSKTILVIVEFGLDIDDEDWKKFYSVVTKMNRGSKVIIISRHETVARFGSVTPFFLNTLSYEEYRYLFKTLAFGSADLAEHSQLVQIADEFAKEMQSRGSLVMANALADVLRRNLNVQFWHCMIDRCRKTVQKNLSTYGVIPKFLLQKDHPVDITEFFLHSGSPIHVIPYTSSSNAKYNDSMKDIPKVKLGELLMDPTIWPTGDFNLIPWESRIPPYTAVAYFVSSYTANIPQGNPFSGRKRREVPI